MLCHYYVIESMASHGEWIVAEEDDEKAIASLPAEGKPYEIIWKTDPVERNEPLMARLHAYPSTE